MKKDPLRRVFFYAPRLRCAYLGLSKSRLEEAQTSLVLNNLLCNDFASNDVHEIKTWS